jgi:transposase
LLTVSLFNDTINTEVFTGWLIQDLVPKLPPNSIVVMDNASFHKDTLIKEMLHLEGHTLEYLPPYSPDLNPIEHKWAQAKSIRRKYRCSIDELFERHCR